MSSAMGEIKSVKVDNWGVFFLQKLQNFFNKTDYCDLTLQFHDNSQLKVHRLVLSACTDYFNVLEQTCEVIDDALIMPNELQADVVVPIVNFMYTGTLEFELKMYGKLLRTAKEMNMTVLLKLLEAHRRTMEGVNRSQRPPSPKAIRRRGVPGAVPQYQTQPQRRILTSSNATLQRRVIQTKPSPTNSAQFRQQIGSTSLLRTTATQQNSEYNTSTKTQQQSTSPFEQLRKGYNNTKRPATISFDTPPAKKPNIEDVKEFAEQQRMRKQIAAEYGEDHEYEGLLDDDIHNDDDDEETTLPTSSSTSMASTSRQTQQQTPSATITFKHENDKPPTIVVKDTSNSKMNHAKIISEVLRQYPHLVKSNKNIKLKIMPSASGQTQKIIVKKEQGENASGDGQPQQKSVTTASQISSTRLPLQKPLVPANSVPSDATVPQTGQKRRIDSKTMHTLIAQGAENTTGPWLCLRCGVNGRPISIPSYRSFRRHLINTHKEVIDTALCEHCGWRSSNHRELHYHMQMEHKLKSGVYTFPGCLMCANTFLDNSVLNQHMIDSHPDENQQQCIYCNKIFAKESQLYIHIKTYHKKQALEDGIIDYSDEEYLDPQVEALQKLGESKETKVKILSDISIPGTSLIKMESNAEATGLNAISVTNAEGLAGTEGDIVGEPKFINADGNEVILTEEQRKEIMAQLNQEHEGGVVMLLNENVFPVEAAADTVTANDESTERAVSLGRLDVEDVEASNVEDFDDSQIYSEFASEHADPSSATKSKKNDPEALDERKETAENLEWAENVISSQDSAGQTTKTKQISEQKSKSHDDISKKLKELTGDWSDDENEDAEAVATEDSETAAGDEPDASFDPEFLISKGPKKENIDKSEPEEEKQSENTDNEKDEENSNVEEKTQELNKDTIDEPNVDEDDIELAMKSLHKDDVSDAEHREDETNKNGDVKDTFEVDAKASDDETLEKSATEESREEASAKDKVDENDDDESKEHGEDDANPLEENVKKALIDELIAEASSENVKEDCEEEEESKPVEKENAQDSKLEETNENKTISINTADKVKSLISEWGDDDDEVEEEL